MMSYRDRLSLDLPSLLSTMLSFLYSYLCPEDADLSLSSLKFSNLASTCDPEIMEFLFEGS